MKVNKKVVILVFAIIAAVVILLSRSAVLPATAQPATLLPSTAQPTMPLPLTPTAVTITATPTKSKLSELLNIDPNVKAQTSEPTYDFSHLKAIDAAQATKNTEVIAQAQKLISKAEKAYLTTGWLHLSDKTKAFETAQRTFADGITPIPTEWTDDTWMLLDKNGDVIKAVSIQDTGDPQLMQITVYENGAWKNISLGTPSEPEKYHPFFGADELSNKNVFKDFTKLAAETSVVNGQNTVVFSIEQDMKTIKNDGNAQRDEQVYASIIKHYYAADSGLPVQIEDYTVNSKGILKITQRILTKIIEKINTPPDNILAYFTH